MIGEIISVGDELTSGQRLDTNSQYLSQQLADLGVSIRHHVTVGDVLADNVAAFRLAASRSQIVIISGGLGPTADDLTREAMAEAFGLPLEHREEAMEHITKLFRTRGRPMPERNRVQALFPTTSRIIPNPHGTAPGIDLTVDYQGNQSRLFALPGVPAEMIQMLSETVVPRLTSEMGVGTTKWFYHSIKLFGLGESDVEKVIPDLIARDRIPRVGITVSKATITLRIAAECQSESEFHKLIQPTVVQIQNDFHEFIFGSGEQDIQDVVLEKLSTLPATLSVVEFGSGCWVGRLLTDGIRKHIPNSTRSGVANLSWVPDTDPVSLEQMVHRAKQSIADFRTDYALVVGVYPPSHNIADADGLPTTTLQIVIASKTGLVQEHTMTISGHPELFYQRLAKTALYTFLKEWKHV